MAVRALVAMTSRGQPGRELWAGALAERRLELGRPFEAAEANRQARLAAPSDFGLQAQRIRILVRLQELDEAWAAFDEADARARSVEDLSQLFELVPLLFEGWGRTVQWLNLKARLARMDDAGRTAGAEATLALRVRLALRDHPGFLSRLANAPPDPSNPLRADLERVGAVVGAARYPDFGRLRVFGIGLSKSGTTSLARALSLLGFHGMHFTNRLTHEVLTPDDAFLFDALTDTPVCAVFETLYHRFPQSRFVYTVREPTRWQASFNEHYRRQHQANAFEGLADRLSTRGAVARGQERAAIYASLFSGHTDALSARAAFEDRVASFFAAHDCGRLLRMNICAGEGWEKLCPFLERPVPALGFPWENQSLPSET